MTFNDFTSLMVFIFSVYVFFVNRSSRKESKEQEKLRLDRLELFEIDLREVQDEAKAFATKDVDFNHVIGALGKRQEELERTYDTENFEKRLDELEESRERLTRYFSNFVQEDSAEDSYSRNDRCNHYESDEEDDSC